MPTAGSSHYRYPAIKRKQTACQVARPPRRDWARGTMGFGEFAGAVMQTFEFVGSRRDLHPRLVDGKAPDLVYRGFDEDEAIPGGAAG